MSEIRPGVIRTDAGDPGIAAMGQRRSNLVRIDHHGTKLEDLERFRRLAIENRIELPTCAISTPRALPSAAASASSLAAV